MYSGKPWFLLHRAHCPCRFLVQSLNFSYLKENGTGINSEPRDVTRGVPRTFEDLSLHLNSKPVSPPDSRVLKIAVIGAPNSGKSTLINQLIGWKVCSVSKKVHTTQCSAKAVHNVGSAQLIFLDTPGVVSQKDAKRYSLKSSLVTDAALALHTADLIAVTHDISKKHTCFNLSQDVLRLLVLHPLIPSVLILNKIDLLKSKSKLLAVTKLLTCGIVGDQRINSHLQFSFHKPLDKEKIVNKYLQQMSHEGHSASAEPQNFEEVTAAYNDNHLETAGGVLLEAARRKLATVKKEDVFRGLLPLSDIEATEFARHLKGWPRFSEVFMVSALEGTGIPNLLEYFKSSSYSSPWLFSADVVTDQDPHQIALLATREAFMNKYKNEIPYHLKFNVELWEVSDADVLNIIIKVHCKRAGLARLLIGGKGSNISSVSKEAEQTLRNVFRSEVSLRLNVTNDIT